jgi:acetyl-CoA C-acetyltransferase/acetyl-CoA acyltransferase
MRRVAVVGTGQTRFSGAQSRTNVELFCEAAMEALKEANLKTSQVQALLVGNALSDYEEGQQIAHAFIAENLGLPHVRPILQTGPVLPPVWRFMMLFSG